MQFQQDWPKVKKYSSFNFLAENLEIFGSTEHYDAALDNLSLSQLFGLYVNGKLSIR